jgi:hypothetical protein
MAGKDCSCGDEHPQEGGEEWIEEELRLLNRRIEEENTPKMLVELAARLEQLAALRHRRRR